MSLDGSKFVVGFQTHVAKLRSLNCLNCTSMCHEEGMSNVIYCSRSGKVISDSSGIETVNTDICALYNEKSIFVVADEDTEELPF